MQEKLWSLDTSTKVKGLTWWWWWWLFFIDNPANPDRPRQLMILWSTKNCKKVKIDDYSWKRKHGIENENNSMKFNGITAAWYFDGTKMHDPLLLDEHELHCQWDGNEGKLQASTGIRLFEGNEKEYKVKIEHNGQKFDFKLLPWTKFQSEPHYSGRKYVGKLGYDILKIHGVRLEGKIGDEKVTGTAYFQKVMVNAPAVPWYWGLFHFEDGSYFDYFMPHVGLQCLRRSNSPKSAWDRGHVFMARNAQFFHEPTGKHYLFKNARIRKLIENGLPIFQLTAKENGISLKANMAAYSRACWRFEQKALGLKTKLFYNEYPTDLLEFELKDGSKIITKKELGKSVGNTEHAWGTLA